MKSIYITLFAFLFLFSCKGDNEETQEPNDAYMLKGKYNLVTLTSDIPMDLNHDGTATNNMLQELDFTYPNDHIFKVKESLYFFGWIPAAQFWPQFNDYDVYNYKQMSIMGHILRYDENTNVLEYSVEPPFVHEPHFPEDIYTPTTPIVTNMEILPDMKIKITMQHRYTETPETYPDCWTNIVLTAVYEKYSDNPD